MKVWAVEPSNPNKVRVYGPGVEKGVKTNQPTFFTVDCTGAGSGEFILIKFYFQLFRPTFFQNFTFISQKQKSFFFSTLMHV